MVHLKRKEKQTGRQCSISIHMRKERIKLDAGINIAVGFIAELLYRGGHLRCGFLKPTSQLFIILGS
jgi:hypothetical protein